MLVKFNMTTQSHARGAVVNLQEDESLRSLLERGIVSRVELETKPAPALETKPAKKGRPRKVKPDV